MNTKKLYTLTHLTIASIFVTLLTLGSCQKKQETATEAKTETVEEVVTEEVKEEATTPETKAVAAPQKTQVSASTSKESTSTSVTAESPEVKEIKAEPKVFTLASGGMIDVKLDGELSTDSVKVGNVFSALVTKDVVADDATVIPAGSVVKGEITKVKNEKKLGGKSHIELTLKTVTLSGADYALVTKALYFEGKNKIGKTALNAGVGAAAGALAGNLGSKKGNKTKGTLIGAAAGAAAGVGATALGKKGSYTLESGMELSFELTDNVEITM
ncbi:hypothetical protein [Sediminitomix flava]|uniref:Outer membrane lipoprotein SlyB n=1 Tax=Sediminitomix flava TaxID=379075 RepID=A0A315YW98_SEDFL|nr:hypothetical protein [Sediminitomix flava]PWJ34185.1 hypothetical protein BC781_11195 [Sediminitomix flava]